MSLLQRVKTSKYFPSGDLLLSKGTNDLKIYTKHKTKQALDTPRKEKIQQIPHETKNDMNYALSFDMP